MIPLTNYALVKDRYCLCYYGPHEAIIKQLIEIRPEIETKLPGLQLYFSFREDLMYVVENEDRIVVQRKMREVKRDFGYIRQLTHNMVDDPIQTILQEVGLEKL